MAGESTRQRYRSATLVCILLGVGWSATQVLAGVGRSMWVPVVIKLTGARTVSDVVRDVGPVARSRLERRFDAAGLSYPPDQITLLAIKETAVLELWVGDAGSPSRIHDYPIKALSGVAGPKLREGDRQVPEGIYRIEGLNPNSAYHLSMKLNYPNAFDLEHAANEGRDEPGSNIFIHGKAQSIGCLAMGDEAIEELFVLMADVGWTRATVVISPTDPRLGPLDRVGKPHWVDELYSQIEAQFSPFR